VTIIDTSGNRASSYPAYAFFIDTFPPEPPAGLNGYTDTLGVTHLSWTSSKENDLLGYRLYWSNSPNHTFTMVEGAIITDTFYSVAFNAKTLSERILFKVVAVDKAYGHSDFSEALEVERLDIVPPSPGAFTNIQQSDQGILLEWTPSGSFDLAKQELWKRVGTKDWTLLEVFPIDVERYLDTMVQGTEQVQYALVAVDDDGLKSEKSLPVGLWLPKIRTMDRVESLNASFSEDGREIVLSWEIEAKGELKYIIYRATQKGAWKSYQSVSGNNEFTDTDLPLSDQVQYALRVIDSSGKRSELTFSNTIQLR
jgi:fibronectin type 3 domain-containing protein